MAIVEMKKMTLVAMNADRHRIIRHLQRLGCVQLIKRPIGEELPVPPRDMRRFEELDQWLNRLDWAILKLSPYDPIKNGMMSTRRVAKDEEIASARAWRGEASALVDRLEEIERAQGDLRSRELKARAQIEALLPWEALPVPLERVGETRHTASHLITAAASRFALAEAAWAALPVPALTSHVSQKGGAVYAMITYHKSISSSIETILQTQGIQRVRFEGAQGTVALAIDQARAQRLRIDEVRAQLQGEIQALGREIQQLRVLRDIEAMTKEQLEAVQKIRATRSAFVLTGWTPADCVRSIEAAIGGAAAVYELGFEDPAEDEKPPTLLQNHALVRPFEQVIGLYSLPDPRGFDPTAVMAPFFACFFGMMVSDAGYGVLIALLAALYLWKTRSKSGAGQIAGVLVFGGIATLFWGIMYGGWFGISVTPVLLSPLESPLECMILCVGVGYLQVLFGVGIAAYMNVKNRKPLDALFDQGAWLLILIGVPVGALNLWPIVGWWPAIVGAVAVLLTGGRQHKNPFKRLLIGAGRLYDAAGYVSDILSYVRLFGMGLATGVIGMVINLLCSMMMGNPVGFVIGCALLAVGHAFNIGINVLGAYINGCRLQYIEFFGRFYEQGGEPFRPLRRNTRYVEVDAGCDA